MNKKAAGIVLIIVLVLAGSGLWYLTKDRNVVKKPAVWGLSNPPATKNVTWTQDGSVQIAREKLSNAPTFYGEIENELLELGYAMDMGNWSNTKCQWSVWSSEHWNRTYYIAYSSDDFIAIRGPYSAVMNATNKTWLCQRPSAGKILNSPSPQKTAQKEALFVVEKLMKQNVNVNSFNWTKPLPDWYLAKTSFRASVGDGVDVLILVYTSDEQMKYAEHILKKEDGNLRILEDSGGQYYSLIVLKGNPADVETVVKAIQEESTPGNSTVG